MSTVRDAVLDLMRRLDLTTIFGNPGSTEIPFLTGLPDDFRFVLGLHEGVVVGMANGYALARGKPAFVNLHTAPGLGNAVNALVCARDNRVPLVVVVGQQDRRQLARSPFLTGRSLERLAGDYPVWTTQPACAQDVPRRDRARVARVAGGARPGARRRADGGLGRAGGRGRHRGRVAGAAVARAGGRRGCGGRGRCARRRGEVAGARRRCGRGQRRGLGRNGCARGAARVPRVAGAVRRARGVSAGSPVVRRASPVEPRRDARDARAARSCRGGRHAGVPALHLRSRPDGRRRHARRRHRRRRGRSVAQPGGPRARRAARAGVRRGRGAARAAGRASVGAAASRAAGACRRPARATRCVQVTFSTRSRRGCRTT